MGPTEWFGLAVCALALTYCIALRAGWNGGRSHERYLASLEKMKRSCEASTNKGDQDV